jgi:hypothetical protein
MGLLPDHDPEGSAIAGQITYPDSGNAKLPEEDRRSAH